MSIYFVAINDNPNYDTIFAGNCDRPINDATMTVHKRARDISNKSDVKFKGKTILSADDKAFLGIDFVGERIPCFLLKSESLWGAESGANKHGLCGAVVPVKSKLFVKSKFNLDAQSMLRFCLEWTKSADDALSLLLQLFEKNEGAPYTLDGENLSSSFIISDKDKAIKIETASKCYCVKTMTGGHFSISNCYTITTDFDIISENAKSERSKLLKDKEGSVNFAETFGNKKWAKKWCAQAKIEQINLCMEKYHKTIISDKARELLRSHAQDNKSKQEISKNSVCMHGSNDWNYSTAASIICCLNQTRNYYYFTAASMPCVNIFKPVSFCDNIPIYGEEDSAVESWLRREKLVRYIISGQINKREFNQISIAFENKYATQYEAADSDKEQDKLARKAWAASHAIVRSYRKAMNDIPYRYKLGNWRYRNFWRKKLALLFPKLIYHKRVPY